MLKFREFLNEISNQTLHDYIDHAEHVLGRSWDNKVVEKRSRGIKKAVRRATNRRLKKDYLAKD